MVVMSYIIITVENVGFSQTPFISIFSSKEFSNSPVIRRKLNPISVPDFIKTACPISFL